MEKLNSEVSQLQEELSITKLERSGNVKAETQVADFQESFDNMVLENKNLKSQIEVQVSTDILDKEETSMALNDVKG